MPPPSTIEIVLPDSGRAIAVRGTFTTSATSLFDSDIDFCDNNLPTNGHTINPVRVFTASRAPQWHISAGSTPSSSVVSRRAVCLRDWSAGSRTPPGNAHSFRWWRTSPDRLISSNSGSSSRPPKSTYTAATRPDPQCSLAGGVGPACLPQKTSPSAESVSDMLPTGRWTRQPRRDCAGSVGRP